MTTHSPQRFVVSDTFIFKTPVAKKVQAAGVVLRCEGGRCDRIRLLKLLYIADRESMAAVRFPIVGGRLSALDNGPLHSDVYNLLKGEHVAESEWSDHFSNDGHTVVMRHDPGRLELSQFEIRLLTEVCDRFRSVDTWELVELTHGFAEWIKSYAAGTSRPIKSEDVLRAVGAGEDEIESVRDEAESQARVLRAMAH